MLINTLSYLIVVSLLVWHVVRLVRVWRVTHTVSVFSALFIPALALQLVAILSDHDWAKWIAALILIVIFVWRFKGPGAVGVPLEDLLASMGISHAEFMERSRAQDELRRIDEDLKERERQIESDRKSWWKAFEVEARLTEINFDLELPEFIQLKTDEPLHFTLGPGKYQVALAGWEKLPVEADSYEIRLWILVTDHAGVVWTSEYRVDIECLVNIGFSSTPKRKPGELHAWTEIDPEMERTFRENCLVAKAVYHTDMRDWIEARIGSHDYVVHTKYKRGVIDLAWDEKSSRVLLRLAGLIFRERDGVSYYDLDPDDEVPGSDTLPWDAAQIEPVVFPIHPEEMLPFGMNGLTSPYQFDEKVEPWPPLFSRLYDPVPPLSDSEFQG